MAKLINGIEFKGKQLNNERSSQGIFDVKSYKEAFQNTYTKSFIQIGRREHRKRASFTDFTQCIEKKFSCYDDRKSKLKQQITPHETRLISNNIANLIKSKLVDIKQKQKQQKGSKVLDTSPSKEKKGSHSAYINARKKILEKQNTFCASFQFQNSNLTNKDKNSLIFHSNSKNKEKGFLFLQPLALSNSKSNQKQGKQTQLSQQNSSMQSSTHSSIKFLQKILTKNRQNANLDSELNFLASRLQEDLKSKNGFIKIKRRRQHSNLMINSTRSDKLKSKQQSFQNIFEKYTKNFADQKNLQEQEIQLFPQVSLIELNKNAQLKKTLFEKVNSRSVMILHCKDNVFRSLFSVNQKQKSQIASITKIMTSYLILTLSMKFELDIKTQKIIISEKASKMQGTTAKLAYSDTCTVYQALHALMLPSGNDAAVALGEWGGKTIRRYSGILRRQRFPNETQVKNEKSLNFLTTYAVKRKSHQKLFVHHMNKMAKFLKLKATHFINTHGLMNDKAYSCSQDIALLTSYVMKDPIFREIVGKKVFKCKLFNRTFSCSKDAEWENTNKLLGIQGFVGVKTGITPSAGPCLASLFEVSTNEYFIVVILKTKCCEMRFKQTVNLLKITIQNLLNSSCQRSHYEKSLQNLSKYDKLAIKQDEKQWLNNCRESTTSNSDKQEDQFQSSSKMFP